MDKASRWENYTADAKISLAAFLSHGASSFEKENCLYQGFQRQILGNFLLYEEICGSLLRGHKWLSSVKSPSYKTLHPPGMTIYGPIVNPLHY